MTSEARSTPRPPPAAAVADAAVRQRRDRVFGRALRPLAATAGHELVPPTGDELDRFDPAAVAAA